VPFVALDDEPQVASPKGSFVPLDEPQAAKSSFVPLDEEPQQPQAPAPEGVFQSFLHPIERYLPTSLATAAGGIAGGAAGGLAGIETGPGAIATAVAGDIAGGTAAGAAYEKAREAIIGPEATRAEEAQLAANEQANPWSSKIGGMIGQLPAFIGGGAGLFKGAKAAAEKAGETFVPTALQSVAEQAKGGARMLGAQEAGQEATGQKPFSWGAIPEAIAQGAITMGPLGFVSKIPGLGEEATSLVGKTLQTAGHAAGSAEILAHSNALYNSVVKGEPYDELAVQKTAASDAPAFALIGAAGHIFNHPAVKDVNNAIDQTKEVAPATAAVRENEVKPLAEAKAAG